MIASLLSELASDPEVISQAMKLLEGPERFINLVNRYIPAGTPMPETVLYEVSLATTAMMTGGTYPRLWRNVDLTGVPSGDRLRAIVMLAHPQDGLTQDVWNFLTGGESIRIDLGKRVAQAEQVVTVAGMNKLLVNIAPETRALAAAFVKSLLEEAETGRMRGLAGAHQMAAMRFPFLDDCLGRNPYHTIRMVFSPYGIRAALVLDDAVAPLYWSPEYTTVYAFGDNIGWALNVMFAGIWRDACTVREKWRTVRRIAKNTEQSSTQNHKQRMKILPRTIYHVEWGRDDQERGAIRARHTVPGFFRQLPAGQDHSPEAAKTAEREGRLPPPAGWTYVKTHQRGEGTGQQSDQSPVIVCRGLQAVTMLLSRPA